MSGTRLAPARRPLIIMTVVMAYDLAAAAACMYAAIGLRFAIAPVAEMPSGLATSATLMFLASCAVVFPLQRLHRGVWRFMSGNDALRIVNAVALANLLFLLALFLINRLDGFPRSTVVIEGPLLVAALAGARYLRQLAASGDWRSLVRLEDQTKPAAILAGGHAALDEFLRDLARRPNGPPFRVRALAEPNGDERGRSIHGAPVLGGAEEARRALISLASVSGQPPQLVLVDPALKSDAVKAFADAAAQAGATLVRARITGGRAALTPLDAADLLARPPRKIDDMLVRQLAEGRRVLITGAGGTIGSELTRQVARAGPARLVLLDASELNLFEIETELRESGLDTAVEAFLGDVRDGPRVAKVAEHARPDIVLHAAALKHVPLMERNPAEAVLTNVLGTMTVAEAARAAGARAFVLISTDKAVNPSNVMGASKRAAEMFVQALDATGGMRAASVRFGNVLGSTGSVVPTFERQISRGQPITVTHPEITRYFMTVQEAAGLVLQAAALVDGDCEGAPDSARAGGVFVLDMGDPVRIDHLARELCRLRGLIPDRDIPIRYIGLREGEKVHEDLFYRDEEVEETAVDGVSMAQAAFTPLNKLRPRLEILIDAARRRDRGGVYHALATLVPQFAPPSSNPETGEGTPREGTPDEGTPSEVDDQKIAAE